MTCWAIVILTVSGISISRKYLHFVKHQDKTKILIFMIRPLLSLPITFIKLHVLARSGCDYLHVLGFIQWEGG